MTKKEINKYANWLLQDCNTPIDEIEWLVSQLPKNIQNNLKEEMFTSIMKE